MFIIGEDKNKLSPVEFGLTLIFYTIVKNSLKVYTFLLRKCKYPLPFIGTNWQDKRKCNCDFKNMNFPKPVFILP